MIKAKRPMLHHGIKIKIIISTKRLNLNICNKVNPKSFANSSEINGTANMINIVNMIFLKICNAFILIKLKREFHLLL